MLVPLHTSVAAELLIFVAKGFVSFWHCVRVYRRQASLFAVLSPLLFYYHHHAQALSYIRVNEQTAHVIIAHISDGADDRVMSDVKHGVRILNAIYPKFVIDTLFVSEPAR